MNSVGLDFSRTTSTSLSPLFVWNWPEMLLKLIYTVNESIHLLPTIPSCCKAKKRCFCQAADKNVEAETGKKVKYYSKSNPQTRECELKSKYSLNQYLMPAKHKEGSMWDHAFLQLPQALCFVFLLVEKNILRIWGDYIQSKGQCRQLLPVLRISTVGCNLHVYVFCCMKAANHARRLKLVAYSAFTMQTSKTHHH